MAVPKKRNTKSRRDRRRANIFLKAPVLGICPKCKQPIMPHTVCSNCGFYKGVERVDVLKKLEKKERKQKEKEMKESEKKEAREQRQKPPTMEELSKRKF